jgi:cytochrome P450
MMQSFLPFASGRRNCQGQAFANAEMHMILARLIDKYEFSVVDKGKIEYNVVLRMVGTLLNVRRA